MLGAPRKGEEELIEEAIQRAADAVLRLLVDGPLRVMNEVNTREPPS